jgi:hypothetical protein
VGQLSFVPHLKGCCFPSDPVLFCVYAESVSAWDVLVWDFEATEGVSKDSNYVVEFVFYYFAAFIFCFAVFLRLRRRQSIAAIFQRSLIARAPLLVPLPSWRVVQTSLWVRPWSIFIHPSLDCALCSRSGGGEYSWLSGVFASPPSSLIAVSVRLHHVGPFSGSIFLIRLVMAATAAFLHFTASGWLHVYTCFVVSIDTQKGKSLQSLKYAFVLSPVDHSLLMNFTIGNMRDTNLVSSALADKGHATFANMSSGMSQCLARKVLNFGSVACSLRISSER